MKKLLLSFTALVLTVCAFAQKKAKLIDTNKHLILTSGHPSPMSANQGKWFGNKHFSKTNAYLEGIGKKGIEW